ncbi:hypothetical protein TRFO_19601 [Tritrichomonas foetus]|uniref:Uncharacterized protein n=1 Tax=Tritrichomonas foetus TaxID=1144522 RepID=A0A1J4KI85_9EUKA|nr:hypothetical protein TRFO_19601 [Tritrichomonas foetus]|eukprot:OHT10923.1 hypothetical protein TRFO_19601 [Tritrichomonas foetus]
MTIFFSFLAYALAKNVCVVTKTKRSEYSHCDSTIYPKDFENYLSKYSQFQNAHGSYQSLHLYISNDIENPLLVKYDFVQSVNIRSLIFHGDKKSSFVEIDFCGKDTYESELFEYDGVTVYPTNTKNPFFGKLFTENVDFAFSGFRMYSNDYLRHSKDIPKSVIKRLQSQKEIKSTINFNDSSTDPVFIGELLSFFNGVKIYDDEVVFYQRGGGGQMGLSSFRNGSAFLTQNTRSPDDFYFDCYGVSDSMPFVSLSFTKETQIYIEEFPKQKTGIPPVGINHSTTKPLHVFGKSSENSKFVYFSQDDSTDRSIDIQHSDICPIHSSGNIQQSSTLNFNTLKVINGEFIRLGGAFSIHANEIYGTAYSFREAHSITSNNKGYSYLTLTSEQNTIVIKNNEMIISDRNLDNSITFGVDSNSIICVRQRVESPSDLLVITDSVSDENNPYLEIEFIKESTLRLKSLQDQSILPHIAVFSGNPNEAITITSENINNANNKAGFLFGPIDSHRSKYIVNGAAIYTPDVDSQISIGDLEIIDTDFHVHSQNTLFDINILKCKSSFLTNFPGLNVMKELHIKDEVQNGQSIPCTHNLNVYLDIPTSLKVNNVVIRKDSVILQGQSSQQVTFTNLTNGFIHLKQLATSPSSFSATLENVNNDMESISCVVFQFSNEIAQNTFEFAGDNWNLLSHLNFCAVKLVSQNKLTIKGSSHIAASIVNLAGGELIVNDVSSSFGFHELSLYGKIIFNFNSTIQNSSLSLYSFIITSSATFSSVSKKITIDSKIIDFDLSAFSFLPQNNLYVDKFETAKLRGHDLKADQILNFDESSKLKELIITEEKTTYSFYLNLSSFVFVINSHSLTFNNFINEVSIQTLDSNNEVKVESFHLNQNSIFSFSNKLNFQSDATLKLGSRLENNPDLLNGTIHFSNNRIFTIEYSLDYLEYPAVYSPHIESVPYILDFKYVAPNGTKLPSYEYSVLKNKHYPIVCSPELDCNAFINAIDLESPFSDDVNHYIPECHKYEDNNYDNLKCISLVMKDNSYIPTQSRTPRPPTIDPSIAPSPSDESTDDNESDGGGSSKKVTIIVVVVIVLVVVVGCVIGFFVFMKIRKAKADNAFIDPALTAIILDDKEL